MRTLADHEIPLDSAEPADSQDLTLGMGALLAIFFAIVLVCAVFFGFGYSTGRTTHTPKAPVAALSSAPTAAKSTTEDFSKEDHAVAQTAAMPMAAVEAPPKPRPGAPLEENVGAGTAPEAGSYTTREKTLASESALRRPRRDDPAAAPLATRQAAAMSVPRAAPETGSFMVQIAAVVRQADAETLAQALRKNGYNAVVRTEPQDKFLHVQIGPFATRDEAKAMRARLADRGYNAFLKQ